jgi:putative NIF3 family GTP cyclohydrolase 1 type 2
MAVCSGNGKPLAQDLLALAEHKVDLLVSGEIGEGDPAIAKQAGFHYFSAGHYATEVFGVQELGKKIKAHFKNKLEVEFIDIPNIL